MDGLLSLLDDFFPYLGGIPVFLGSRNINICNGLFFLLHWVFLLYRIKITTMGHYMRTKKLLFPVFFATFILTCVFR